MLVCEDTHQGADFTIFGFTRRTQCFYNKRRDVASAAYAARNSCQKHPREMLVRDNKHQVAFYN